MQATQTTIHIRALETVMDWIARARTLATEAHAGQVDKAGQAYIGHVGRVAARVRGDDDAEVVAWLHDVVEDCPGFAAQVQHFPAAIQHAVQLLSRNGTDDATRYYARIAADPLALKVKLADIADNADEHRLAALDAATAERLRGKYQHALAQLGQLPASLATSIEH
jgi:(p)ppGpp synthase/HD superfamily hydrolase